MRQFLVLLRKNLLLELRSMEALALLFSLVALLAVVFSLALQLAVVPQSLVARIYPAVLWSIFPLVAVLFSGKSQESEVRDGALEGLLLAGARPEALYLAKVCSETFYLSFAAIVAAAVLGVLLDTIELNALLRHAAVGTLLSAGVAALSVLLGGAALNSRLRALLLPLLVVPMLFPPLFAALQLSFEVSAGAGLDPGSIWLSLLIGVDLLYVVLGINLYEQVLRG